MQKITPFLWYANEAEEAAAFYASIFPDSRLNRVVSLPSDAMMKMVKFYIAALRAAFDGSA